MTLVHDIRKTAGTTGDALLGLTDLAVEKVRDARHQAIATRNAIAQIDPKGVQRELVGQAEKAFEDLVTRGDALATRLRTQRATKNLVAQVDTTIAIGKGAVTTARKAVDATASSAKATITTGRKEATKTVDTIVDTVSDDIETVAPAVKASAKRTRTAAKKTATTARKGAVRTTSRAKATGTTAKKSAAKAATAAEDGAQKVGD